jgi:Fe-S cluster assembly protein SufB
MINKKQLSNKYKYGFNDQTTTLFQIQKGLNESVVKLISKLKKEPQ